MKYMSLLLLLLIIFVGSITIYTVYSVFLKHKIKDIYIAPGNIRDLYAFTSLRLAIVNSIIVRLKDSF